MTNLKSLAPLLRYRSGLLLWLAPTIALAVSVVLYVCDQPHRCCSVLSSGAQHRAMSWAAASPLISCAVSREVIEDVTVAINELPWPSDRSLGSIAAAASRQVYLAQIGGLYGP